MINERLIEKNHYFVPLKLWEHSIEYHRFFILGITYTFKIAFHRQSHGDVRE